MVVSPSNDAGFYMQFTNTSRTSESPMAITAITDPNATVTVSVPSVAGMAPNEDVTITGFTGSSAPYNGTYVITSVNTSNNTFTFIATNYAILPANGTGGTALVNPQNGITNLYVMQPTTLGGNRRPPREFPRRKGQAAQAGAVRPERRPQRRSAGGRRTCCCSPPRRTTATIGRSGPCAPSAQSIMID